MPSAGAPTRARIASQSVRHAAHGIAPVASRSSKYTRARDGRRLTSSPISCTRVNERSFERSAAAYSPTGYGPDSRLSGMPVVAGEAGCADVDTQRSIGASIDDDAPLRPPAWLLRTVPKHNTGRRGRSRKRRPGQHSARELSDRAKAPARRAPRAVDAVGEPKTLGERPQAPWHPLPLSELLILVG